MKATLDTHELATLIKQRDRYEEALRRVVRDRREPDKILMEVQLTLGLTVDDVRAIDHDRRGGR